MNVIRPAQPSDRTPLAALRHALWPEATAAEHAQDLDAIFGNSWSVHYPYVVLVSATSDGALAGFIELTLASRADGCDPSHPIGYVEGWLIVDGFRGQGIGAALMRAAEDWARALGCREMASDTWIDNEVSQRAHEALGFEVVDRCVNYRKTL